MNRSYVAYVEYLNQTAPPYNSPKWIMYGTNHYSYENRFKYGDKLRLYDPVHFEYGYAAWAKQPISEECFEL